MADDPLEGTLDIYGKGQMIDGKAFNQATFTDKHGNQYPIFIDVFNHQKVKVIAPKTKPTYEGKIQCGSCGNTDFKLRASVFEGVKSVLADCKCGRVVEYRVSDVIDFSNLSFEEYEKDKDINEEMDEKTKCLLEA